MNEINNRLARVIVSGLAMAGVLLAMIVAVRLINWMVDGNAWNWLLLLMAFTIGCLMELWSTRKQRP